MTSVLVKTRVNIPTSHLRHVQRRKEKDYHFIEDNDHENLGYFDDIPELLFPPETKMKWLRNL